MATLIPFVFTQFFDNNGDPLNGGKVYTYEAGTSTPKVTYTDSTGDTANANPVILDSAGRASIWLGDGGYKFILKTSADVTVGTTFDNIGGVASTAFAGNTQEISSNTTVDETLANSAFIATAALTLSLLDVATAGEGFYFSVFAQGGDVTIDPDTTETINNASTLVIPQGSSAIVTCDGDEWWTIAYGPSFSGNNSFTGNNTFTGKVLFPDDGELTIATGAITVTGVYHTVDTQADAATDDLDTINGGSDGQILYLRTENDARDVTLTTAGNIETGRGKVIMENTSRQVQLIYDGAKSKWMLQNNQRRLTNIQYFSADGTYTPTAGVTEIDVECYGSGGGGGGGGGGTNGGNGGAGGDVVFAGYSLTLTASGGGLGLGGGSGATGANGADGTGTNGDHNITGGGMKGGFGGTPTGDNEMGSAGGFGGFLAKLGIDVSGGATAAVTVGAAGTAGTAGSGAAAGMAGAKGYVKVYEYQ